MPFVPPTTSARTDMFAVSVKGRNDVLDDGVKMFGTPYGSWYPCWVHE